MTFFWQAPQYRLPSGTLASLRTRASGSCEGSGGRLTKPAPRPALERVPRERVPVRADMGLEATDPVRDEACDTVWVATLGAPAGASPQSVQKPSSIWPAQPVLVQWVSMAPSRWESGGALLKRRAALNSLRSRGPEAGKETPWRVTPTPGRAQRNRRTAFVSRSRTSRKLSSGLGRIT